LRYDICGVRLISAERLPELGPSASTKSAVTIRLRRERKIPAAGEVLRPAAKWTWPNGSVFLSSLKTANGYLLHFIDVADFFIDETGTEVIYAPRPGVPAHTVRHLILDSVVALVLSLRDQLVFHASAIVTPYGACAFAATSGTGKSTLAASFQQAGYQTLTDDCLLLEEDAGVLYGLPSYPGARLRADSLSLIGAQNRTTLSVAHYNSKRRLSAAEFATSRHRIAAIYCLERPAADQGRRSEPRIEVLSGHVSLLTALRHVFCLDPHDPGMLVRQFTMLKRLLGQIPVIQLTIPDDFAALPRVHDAIISDLKARSQITECTPSTKSLS
jgi:hypothetical protein